MNVESGGRRSRAKQKAARVVLQPTKRSGACSRTLLAYAVALARLNNVEHDEVPEWWTK